MTADLHTPADISYHQIFDSIGILGAGLDENGILWKAFGYNQTFSLAMSASDLMVPYSMELSQNIDLLSIDPSSAFYEELSNRISFHYQTVGSYPVLPLFVLPFEADMPTNLIFTRRPPTRP